MLVILIPLVTDNVAGLDVYELNGCGMRTFAARQTVGETMMIRLIVSAKRNCSPTLVRNMCHTPQPVQGFNRGWGAGSDRGVRKCQLSVVGR